MHRKQLLIITAVVLVLAGVAAGISGLLSLANWNTSAGQPPRPRVVPPRGGPSAVPTVEQPRVPEKVVALLRKRFLGNDRQQDRLQPVSDEVMARVFPGHRFFALQFHEYPLQRDSPTPGLGWTNVFAVTKDDKALHFATSTKLEKFFQNTLRPVKEDQSAKDAVETWLLLSEELTQDGYFQFLIPHQSLVVERENDGRKASGKDVVTRGGTGEIRATLRFNTNGKLTKVEEQNTVKIGYRPRCQATKLLDPDPLVRYMAEHAILSMGRPAKAYLDEERTKVSPELQQAIDRIWQRIVDEGW